MLIDVLHDIALPTYSTYIEKEYSQYYSEIDTLGNT